MTGSVSYHYDYEAYGAVQSNISSSDESDAATTKLYCGEQYDATPGMGVYNLRARYYDPVIGRFNQRDTFAGNIEDPQSLHKYVYTNDDAVNGSDPNGQFTVGELLLVISFTIVLFLAVQELKYEVLNQYSGSPPTATENAALKDARDFISSNKPPVSNKVIDIALHAKIRVHKSLSIDGDDAWGGTHIYGQIGKAIQLDAEAFSLDKRLLASLLIHEATHTLQWSLRNSTDENGAYQNQSDAIRAWGLAGTKTAVEAKIPGSSNAEFINDTAWGFDTYRVNNPAWTE